MVRLLGRFHQLANAVNALQQGDGPLRQLLQRGLRRPGQRVPGVNNGLHGLAGRAARGDVAVGRRVVNKADLGLILAHAAHDFVGAVNLQRNGHARVLLAKLANRPVNQLLRKTLAADHADRATVQAAQRIHLGQHIVAVGQVLAVKVQNELPGFGRHYAAAVALQQGHAQRIFQQADLAADGRGHDAQLFGCRTHRAADHGFIQILSA